jgi:hypothetical protein
MLKTEKVEEGKTTGLVGGAGKNVVLLTME